MRINRVTLEFTGADRELESGFISHFFNHSLPVFRWGFLLGLILYSLFGFLDALAMPEVTVQLWKIRFYLVVPVMLSGIIFSFHKDFKRYWQAAIAVIILVCAFGVFWMIVIGKGPFQHAYYIGNILVMMFGFTFIRARFVWAAATGLIIIAMFEITSLVLTDIPLPEVLTSNFFFIAAWIIGAVASYSMEYFARKNYYLLVLLEKEKKKLDEVNSVLRRQFDEIKRARDKIKILSGFIPICANCKKIRDDKGYWNQIESYIAEHSDAVFSHALCPDCTEELYGGEEWYNNAKNHGKSRPDGSGGERL